MTGAQGSNSLPEQIHMPAAPAKTVRGGGAAIFKVSGQQKNAPSEEGGLPPERP